MFGAVAQLFLLPHDELRQGEAVRHLHRPVLQPLKDQVVHGVADWAQRRTNERECTSQHAGGQRRNRDRVEPYNFPAASYKSGRPSGSSSDPWGRTV